MSRSCTGGVDSLVQHPAALTHRPVAARARPPQGLVRFSIGLEDSFDLIADLDAALKCCKVSLGRSCAVRRVPDLLPYRAVRCGAAQARPDR